jgi:GT2 family glycosyltransferase
MIRPPQVSVIIVNYNAGDLLTQCVQAVLTSTVAVEIFVVDNASVDSSMQQLRLMWLLHQRRDTRVILIENSENLGFARAANQVISETRAEFLLFLNPDCIIRADTLEKFLQTLHEYPRVGMAGALVCDPDGSEQSGCRRSVPSPWRSLVRVLHLDILFPYHPKFQSFVLMQTPLPTQPIEIEGISGACMLVRRAAMAEVGLMDEAYFLHCEDLDWFMRFRAHHWLILFIPTIQVTHVKSFCSRREPLRVLWYKHRGMVRFYRKFFHHTYPRPIFWGVIIAVWIRFGVLAGISLIKSWLSRKPNV